MTAHEIKTWKSGIRTRERKERRDDFISLALYVYRLAGFTYVAATTLAWIATLGI